MPVKATGPYSFPYGYHEVNPYLGKRAFYDMAGLMEWAMAQGAPATLFKSEDLPPEERRDWDADQEAHYQKRLVEQVAWDGSTNKEKEPRPADYKKVRPAKWLVDRGVKTAIVEV